MAKGLDNSSIVTGFDPKSTSVGINWGVRLENESDLNDFLQSLSSELKTRLNGKSIGKISLKLMIAKNPLIAPRKILGHGDCNQHTKCSVFNERKEVFENVLALFKQMKSILNFELFSLRGISIIAEFFDSNAAKLADNTNPRASIDSDTKFNNKKIKLRQEIFTDSVNTWEVKRRLASIMDEDEKLSLAIDLFEKLYFQRQFDSIQSVLLYIKRNSSEKLYSVLYDVVQQYFDNNLKLN